MEFGRTKSSILLVSLTLVAFHAVLNEGIIAESNDIGQALDSFLFEGACKRDSFVGIRKVCEKIDPICPTLLKRDLTKNPFVWCKDFSATAEENGEISMETTTSTGFCPFSLVIEKGSTVTIRCSGEINARSLNRNDPVARIEAHYLDGTYALLENDKPITRKTTVILVSRFTNAPSRQLKCSWIVA